MGTRKLYFGVDGGGSSTRAVLVDGRGTVAGTGAAGASNYQHAGVDGASAALNEALDIALGAAGAEPGEIAAAFFGMAGVVSRGDRDLIRAAISRTCLPRETSVGIDHDIRIALTGGLAGRPGIALIVGTGSSTYGRNAAGETWQCGGWGALVDDTGGAYWVGVEALKATVRQADGRMVESAVKPAMFETLGIEKVDAFMHRVYETGMKREEIARLCPIVLKLWIQGDAVARGIFERGADGLAEMVRVSAEKLRLRDPEVAVSGGVWSSGEAFRKLLCSAVERVLPSARVRSGELPPVLGAAIEARRLATNEGEAEFIERLVKGAAAAPSWAASLNPER